MQHIGKQWPEKFGKPFGLAALFVGLFFAAQISVSVHSHDLFVNHDDIEPAHHQMECGECLIAGMPFHSGDGIGLVHTPVDRNEPSINAVGKVWNGQSVSPSQARAPPRS